MYIYREIYRYIYIYIYVYKLMYRERERERRLASVTWVAACSEGHVSLGQYSAARAPTLPRHISTPPRIKLHVHAKTALPPSAQT